MTDAAAQPVLDVQIHGVIGTFQLRAKFRSQGLATAVFGHSGAGKSSLIQMMAGLQTPQSGHIRIGDTIVFDSNQRINLPVEERRVGMVFQNSRLFPHLSVERNLSYSRWAGGRKPGVEFSDVVKLLSLETFLNRNPLTLSGGEQQRVAIGRALLSDPRILLLDEPLASLDNARKQDILPFIERVAQESRIPVCYVSHSMDEVTRIADDLVVLSRGKTIAFGPLSDILTRLDLGGATGRHEAGAVVPAKVAHHDEALGLTRLMLQTTPPLQFEIALSELPVGADLRLRIRARDVSIARQPVTGLSIRNQLPARIETVRTDDKGYAELVLRLGEDGAGAGLRSRITAASAKDLELSPGNLVFALVKSIAIERRLLQPMGDVSIIAAPRPDNSPDNNTDHQVDSGAVLAPESAAERKQMLPPDLATEPVDVVLQRFVPVTAPDGGNAELDNALSQALAQLPPISTEFTTVPDEPAQIETEAETASRSDPDRQAAPDQTPVLSPGSGAETPEPEAKLDPEPNPFLMKSPTIKRS
uniref:molybdenum ABC transporter ATP-binding protein n=1 Tax=Pararhizobium sp. IMCC3301 TaxID=3067904 RepID=UPI002742508D|nr:molybdenum ABC transporter ATP-binding protein [Pararhizobium sp. IMCC3301]